MLIVARYAHILFVVGRPPVAALGVAKGAMAPQIPKKKIVILPTTEQYMNFCYYKYIILIIIIV